MICVVAWCAIYFRRRYSAFLSNFFPITAGGGWCGGGAHTLLSHYPPKLWMRKNNKQQDGKIDANSTSAKQRMRIRWILTDPGRAHHNINATKWGISAESCPVRWYWCTSCHDSNFERVAFSKTEPDDSSSDSPPGTEWENSPHCRREKDGHLVGPSCSPQWVDGLP